MDVVEVTATFEQYAFTFGGVAPLLRIRPGTAARAVVFLSSPVSSFTTGTNLVVDGALTRGIQL